MRYIEHVAFQVDKPDIAARWYFAQHGAKILHISAVWSLIQVRNIKFAFVKPAKRHSSAVFKVADLLRCDRIDLNRDGSRSDNKADPFGIINKHVGHS